MKGFYMGLDGGGTKTACAVINESGEIVRTSSLPPMNPNGADEYAFEATLRAIEAEAALVGGECLGVCAGMSGKSNKEAAQKLRACLEKLTRGGVAVMGDHELTLYSAVGDGAGAVLISGTGSICYGRGASGEKFRAGGWGYMLGDGGSGYAIGRDILSLALKARDGQVRPSYLTEAVFRELPDTDAILAAVYGSSAGRTTAASFSKLLSDALEAGDPAAKEILNNACFELCETAAAVISKLSLSNGMLGLAGSVLMSNGFVRDGVISRLCERYPKLTVSLIEKDAALAAAQYALAHDCE